MTLNWSDLEIIGSLRSPGDDELPARMRPLARHRQDGVLFAVHDELEPPHLESVETDVLKDPDTLIFAVAMQAHADHRLVQLRPATRPQYLVATTLVATIREYGEADLRRAATLIDQGRRREALVPLVYARNALDADALPVLALIALQRDELDEDARWLHESLLADLDENAVRARWEVARGTPEFKRLAQAIAADPGLDRRFRLRPAYLSRALTNGRQAETESRVPWAWFSPMAAQL